MLNKMESEELKEHLRALQFIVNDNLRAIRLLHCKSKSTDLKYRYAGTPPKQWLEDYKDFFSLKNTVMISVQSLMNSNEKLLAELDKLTSLLPSNESAIEDVFTKPLKDSHARLAKVISNN
jgi:hypothetical protein